MRWTLRGRQRHLERVGVEAKEVGFEVEKGGLVGIISSFEGSLKLSLLSFDFICKEFK